MSKIIQIDTSSTTVNGCVFRSVVVLTDDGRVLRYEDNDEGRPFWDELPPIPAARGGAR